MLPRKRLLLSVVLLPFLGGCFGKSNNNNSAGSDAKVIEPKQTVPLEKRSSDAGPSDPMAFSGDGKNAIVYQFHARKPSIQLWDTAKSQKLHDFSPPQRVEEMAITPNGQWGFYKDFATGWYLIDIANSYQTTPFADGQVTALRFTTDSTKVVGCSDTKVSVWDVKTKKQLHQWAMPATNRVYLFSQLFENGTKLAAFGLEGELFILEVESGKVVHTWKSYSNKDSIRGIAVSPDNRLLVVASASQGYQVWDIATQTLRYTCTAKKPFEGHCQFVDANTLVYVEAVHQNNKSESTIVVEVIGSNKRLLQSKPIAGRIRRLEMLADQKTFASVDVSDDFAFRNIRFWDVAP